MTNRKKTTGRKTSGKNSGNHILVRMYDVGFGDSFLIKIPSTDGMRKVLMDCGSIKQGSQKFDDVIDRIIKDVTDEDGIPRIDVVVCTHRHADHVKGFSNSSWSKVQVREVWMPWTEDPTDAEARRIRETQSSLALILEQQLSKRNELSAYHEIALNALSNEKAMGTLHSGFKGNPLRRFIPKKDSVDTTIRTDALPGVLIYVLGPSHDEDVIRDMDPPSGESYLRLQAASNEGESSAPNPFSAEWCVAPGKFPIHLTLPANFCTSIEKVGEGIEPAVAVALEKAVNGTSLMLLFQIGNCYLLFPGDAQWGTWNRVLSNRDMKDLMKKISFYKVGHHGSHNATPVDFVENVLGKDFWAMVSTHKVNQWPRIPKPELLQAMKERTKKIARSDQPAQSGAAFDASSGMFIDASIPM
jgi:beta-lactamase superfamily II metal-dependent hydrolase